MKQKNYYKLKLNNTELILNTNLKKNTLKVKNS